MAERPSECLADRPIECLADRPSEKKMFANRQKERLTDSSSMYTTRILYALNDEFDVV